MGEITSLTWDQLNLKEKRFELEPDQTKDKEKRFVPIPDTLLKTLVEIPRALHNDHIFLYKGKPLKSIRASLKKACEAVKRMEKYLFNTEKKVIKKSDLKMEKLT